MNAADLITDLYYQVADLQQTLADRNATLMAQAENLRQCNQVIEDLSAQVVAMTRDPLRVVAVAPHGSEIVFEGRAAEDFIDAAVGQFLQRCWERHAKEGLHQETGECCLPDLPHYVR